MVFRFINLVRLFVMVIPLILVLVSGCSHMHNQANANTSNKIAANFQKYQDSSFQLYSGMLNNLAKFTKEENARFERIEKARREKVLNNIKVLTWGNVIDELEEQGKLATKYRKRIKGYNSETQGALADGRKQAKKDIKDTKKEIEELYKARNQWIAKKELLGYAISVVTDIAVEGDLEEDKLKDIYKELKEKKVTIEKYDVNKLKTTKEEKELLDILEDDPSIDEFKKNIENGKFADSGNSLYKIVKSVTYDNFDPSYAPGLKITILSLGLDLYDAELKKLDLEINKRKSLVNLYSPAIGNEDYSRLALKIIRKKGFNREEKVLDTINNIIREAPDLDDSNLNHIYTALSYFTLNQTLYYIDSDYLEVQTAIIEHEYSIRLSALNAMENHAVISRSLEGLVIYHNGGIEPAEVANILNGAVVIALGVIGAGVI